MADEPGLFVPVVEENRQDRVQSFITTQRAEATAQRAARKDETLEASDIQSSGNGVEPSGSLSDAEFDAYLDTMRDLNGFTQSDSRTFTVNDSSGLAAPDPAEVNQSRSQSSIEQDRQLEARVTTDPFKYASDPDSYDFPLVDTPPSVNDGIVEESPLSGQHFHFDQL